MESVRSIEEQRSRILNEMSAIRHVVRGTFKEQMLPVPHRGKKDPVLRGPYYLLAHWEQGKTCSRRVSAKDAAFVRQGADNYKRLKHLCEEFAQLTQRLGELEREQAASAEAEKKGLKSRRRSRPR